METAILTQAGGQAVGSLVAPALDGSKGIFNCLKSKYRYVKNLRKNFDTLEDEYRYLSAKKGDVEIVLEINKLEMEKTRECQTWLEDVERMEDKIEKLKIEYGNTHSFLCGVCPFPALLKLGKEIVKITEEVCSLKDRIGQVRRLMVEKPPASLMRMPAKKIVEFPSLSSHVDKLKECLSNAELKRICLWGPLGVGKTTIMKNLHNAVGEEFDIVFWVTVNRDGDERFIQDILLKRLNIKATDQSEEQKASMISEVLKNKSYLLLLDEVFFEIDLERIGLGINEEHNGKVVFACRQRRICGQTDEDINVRRLSDDDAQNLFWKTVRQNLKGNQDIRKEARKIISECSGMPYMIKLVGNYLADVSDPAIWRETLSELRSPSKEPRKKWDEVYKFLKLEVDKLSLDEKSCFLYLAIFPAGHELYQDYVIECWRAEQFLTRRKKLRNSRDRGHKILHDFVNKSLLEKGKKKAQYKMFEYFQRVAVRFLELSEICCIQDGETNREIKWEKATRISFTCNSRLSSLPDTPVCCRILTLLLQKSSLAEFPASFFLHMDGLQLLDLHKTKIKFLPSSISGLINLKALFLNNCHQLMHLPTEVGSLQSLEIFDIRGTRIYCLPTEIGQLTYLKCLKVSFTENGNVGNHNGVGAGSREMISSNIIVNLHSLEELSIEVSPTNKRWKHIAENIVAEVAALKELTTLSFYFPSMECFQTLINNSKSWNEDKLFEGGRVRSFKIHVGHQESNPLPELDVSECSVEKHLRFCRGEGFPVEVLKMLKQACVFELIGHRDAANLSSFSSENLEGIETCVIEDCREMTSIIVGNSEGGVAFQRLNKLYVNSLPNLVHIWNGPMNSQSLFDAHNYST
ncbi:hypothetical protein Pint_26078 [Pistacia integerrima]|uniref:Uncharacterized protein n=1 Tax=Pistacia integerrima TaxID=434235 RepID=A0ACC0YEF8_9ROSI|nr:hypothetical protein Pint_26078 [Pistacia integerrima]